MARTTVGVLFVATALAVAPVLAQQATAPFGVGAYRANEPGLIKPRLLKQVPPNYPSVAKNASVAGDVELEAVINPDGKAIGHIHLPERCANLCFGGARRNRLFLAASKGLYAVYVGAQGAGLG